MTRASGRQEDGIDLRFVMRKVGRIYLLLVALIPCVVAWKLMPMYGLMLAVPLILAFFIDPTEFPVWAALGFVFLVFMGLRAVADDTGIPWRTAYVVAADRIIGLGHNPTVLLQAWFRRPWVDRLACWTYISFFIMPSLVGIALWQGRRGLRHFVAATIVVDVISLFFLFALPTVPPWMATANGAIEPINRIFMDVLRPSIPQIVDAGYSASANDVAAMPSVHMAITVLAALGLARFGRAAAFTGWTYAALMLFSIVYLGEHWVIDGIAGLLLALYAWRVAAPVAARIFPGPRPDIAK